MLDPILFRITSILTSLIRVHMEREVRLAQDFYYDLGGFIFRGGFYHRCF